MNLVKWLAASLILFSSCKKDDRPGPKPPPAPQDKKYLLKKIEYKTYNYSGTYSYNNDSTLSVIDFLSGAGQQLRVNYTYTNGLITKVLERGSLYETNYEYDAQKRVKTILYGETGQTERAHIYEITYQTDGLIAQLNYYFMNTAGKELKYTNIYYHDENKHLAKVISISAPARFEYTMDSYSGPVSFNPWTFISQGVHEMYPIYNYAVLKNLKKLPTKITVVKTLTSGISTVDRIHENDYTIVNQRLDKSVGRVTYPDFPQYNSTSEVLFFY
ncbi:MAG: hypothetical protein H7Y27_10940 [Gemmatimonadaceae bacterium]|nr:hypothetical protein [Chitinophagaceae bacterium]